MKLVLIHGLGRTPLSMARLARQLRRAGHAPILFGYSPTFETLEGATARLVKRIGNRAGGEDYALVGHSLGTVLIRNALGRLQDHPPRACFFLAAPMRACKAAKFFSRFGPYRWLTGEMGRLLANDAFMAQLPVLPGGTRVYAGTSGPRAPWLPFGTEANDGILSVAEATGLFATVAVEVPALHTFIMNSVQVRGDLLASIERLKQSGPPAPDFKERA